MKKRSLPMLVFTIVIAFVGCLIIFSMLYAPEIVWKAEDALKPLTVKSGRFFIIELESNPSTGYSWTYDITNGDAILYVKDEYIPSKEKNIVGAPGVHRFVFRASGSGNVTLRMKYARSFESGEPLQSWDYAITVK